MSNLSSITEVSTLNSSTTPLNSAAVFTGGWERVYTPSITVALKTDQDGTIAVEFSPDGSNIDSTITYSFLASTAEIHRLVCFRAYFRVKVTNTSAGNQTYLRLQTQKGFFEMAVSALNSSVQQDHDAIVVRAIDSEIDIANNKYSGFRIMNKFGKNPDVDSGTVPEDIWDGGGAYTGFATAAETVTVVSSSANDTAAGTGARTIMVMGLDANYAEISETITLNGTTPVTSVNSYLRLHSANCPTAGSGLANAGTITCAQSVTVANIFFVMQIGTCQTHVSAYTIPAGYTGYMRKLHGAIRGGVSSTVDGVIYVRPFGNTSFRQRRPFTIGLNSRLDDVIFGGITFTEKSDLVLRVTNASTNNLDVSGGYDIILVKN